MIRKAIIIIAVFVVIIQNLYAESKKQKVNPKLSSGHYSMTISDIKNKHISVKDFHVKVDGDIVSLKPIDGGDKELIKGVFSQKQILFLISADYFLIGRIDKKGVLIGETYKRNDEQDFKIAELIALIKKN